MGLKKSQITQRAESFKLLQKLQIKFLFCLQISSLLFSQPVLAVIKLF